MKDWFFDGGGLTEGGFLVFFFGGFAVFVGVVVGVVVGVAYYGSCREAAIFNQLNGTSWTCSDFMWASDQINSQTITVRR